MSSILELVRDRPVRKFLPSDDVVRQGDKTDCLYFLIEGTVEVLKDDVRIAAASEPGVLFGELAVLLGGPHTATVRAVTPCAFYVVDHPKDFLLASPPLCLHLCDLLARRLDALNQYLVDVKRQFEGHDHLGMVDQVLETLLHRQPRRRIRPAESTVGSAELEH